MTIIIDGRPGSGKTTVLKLLQKKLRWKAIDAGTILRQEAKKRKLSLKDFFTQYSTFERKLDRKLLKKAKRGKIIIQSRTLPYLVKTKKIKAFSIFLKAPESLWVRRLVKRDGGSYDEVRTQIRQRERDDRQRYQKLYGIDTSDLSVYDLVVEIKRNNSKKAVDQIIKNLNL